MKGYFVMRTHEGDEISERVEGEMDYKVINPRKVEIYLSPLRTVRAHRPGTGEVVFIDEEGADVWHSPIYDFHVGDGYNPPVVIGSTVF